jgi:hypothetical protein
MVWLVYQRIFASGHCHTTLWPMTIFWVFWLIWTGKREHLRDLRFARKRPLVWIQHTHKNCHVYMMWLVYQQIFANFCIRSLSHHPVTCDHFRVFWSVWAGKREHFRDLGLQDNLRLRHKNADNLPGEKHLLIRLHASSWPRKTTTYIYWTSPKVPKRIGILYSQMVQLGVHGWTWTMKL